MLLGNIQRLLISPGRFFGGTSLSDERANFNNPGDERNLFIGQAFISPAGGQPNGVRHPYTWTMPKGDGGMASFNNASGDVIAFLANLAGGLNAEADLTGVGEFSNAVLQLVVSAAASINSDGQITSANLLATLAAVASLEGTGTFEGDIIALANAVAALAGTSGQDVLLTAQGALTSDITPFTELSPENLAAAVWNSLAATYTDPGTLGKALQDASAAGNPWAALLSSNKDAGSFGEHIQKLLTTGKFIGLK